MGVSFDTLSNTSNLHLHLLKLVAESAHGTVQKPSEKATGQLRCKSIELENSAAMARGTARDRVLTFLAAA